MCIGSDNLRVQNIITWEQRYHLLRCGAIKRVNWIKMIRVIKRHRNNHEAARSKETIANLGEAGYVHNMLENIADHNCLGAYGA